MTGKLRSLADAIVRYNVRDFEPARSPDPETLARFLDRAPDSPPAPEDEIPGG